MHIAVIGAGLAGLICVKELQKRGHSAVVYEKSADVGGRMRTRETELGGFDLGAQYFTATSPAFKTAIAGWRKAGWVAPWEARLASLHDGCVEPAGRRQQRFAAVPGMSTLARRLAEGVDVRTGQVVRRLVRHGEQWLLTIRADTVPIDATAGPFDAVVVAATSDHAALLLRDIPRFAGQAEKARLLPCWALMLAFQDSLGLDYDGAWVRSSRLAWICRDSSKPQRRPGEHWVAHAPAAWSIEHFDDDPERVREKMLKAFHEATGTHVHPVYAQAYRWAYAQSAVPVEADCLWDPGMRVGVCGDWFAAGLDGGGRIENAYLSGTALGGIAG
ncbi:MAG TPA: FAD-dependent oxidoreductase [Paucimonas sp.]|nr:FAD-dependent oxidoreductase [Paucimonas sp.]